MKTNLISIIRAFRPLCALMDEPLDYQTAFSLVRFRKELIPHVEFFNDTERKLIEKYARKNEKGEVVFDGGQYMIDAQVRDEFLKKKSELDGVTVDIPDMKLKKAPESIKPSDLEALMEIMFLPEGGDNDAEDN